MSTDRAQSLGGALTAGRGPEPVRTTEGYTHLKPRGKGGDLCLLSGVHPDGDANLHARDGDGKVRAALQSFSEGETSAEANQPLDAPG